MQCYFQCFSIYLKRSTLCQYLVNEHKEALPNVAFFTVLKICEKEMFFIYLELSILKCRIIISIVDHVIISHYNTSFKKPNFSLRKRYKYLKIEIINLKKIQINIFYFYNYSISWFNQYCIQE